MMLLRDNTLQHLYILLASSIIKIELKKCVVHEIGRTRLHLRPQETQPKWIVCFMSYHRERTGGGEIIFWRGGEGTDWAMFPRKTFFHHQVEQEFILIVPYVTLAWLAWHDGAGCFFLSSEKQWYETLRNRCITCTMCSRNSINFAFWCTKMWMNSSARAL